MLWPWLDAEPEIVTMAGVGLHRIFSDANLRWKEEQTKRRIIYPILTNLLGFSALDLSETMDPVLRYNGIGLHPDYYYPQGCVIETKKIGASLLRYSSDTSNFESTLDQGMSYLDASDARSCIITNGHDWYAIWRTFDDERWQADGATYFGARFRLDEIVENGDHLRLEHFLSMCNSYCLTGQANRSVVITDFHSYPVDRGLYRSTSMLYFADSSALPLKGRGRGFRPPTTASW